MVTAEIFKNSDWRKALLEKGYQAITQELADKNSIKPIFHLTAETTDVTLNRRYFFGSKDNMYSTHRYIQTVSLATAGDLPVAVGKSGETRTFSVSVIEQAISDMKSCEDNLKKLNAQTNGG